LALGEPGLQPPHSRDLVETGRRLDEFQEPVLLEDLTFPGEHPAEILFVELAVVADHVEDDLPGLPEAETAQVVEERGPEGGGEPDGTLQPAALPAQQVPHQLAEVL